MTTIALPQISVRTDIETETTVAAAVREGLATGPKQLPAWLFYDAEGSRLFDQITQLPEYYLTRTERGIFSAHAGDIIDRAAEYDPSATGPDETYEDKPARLRVAELGAGTADKTRLLLRAAAERQGTLLYEPVDVSSSALQAARERIEGEIPGVHVLPRVMDYTRGLDLYPAAHGERRLVLYIGSSIGNFEPPQANEVLEIIRAGLEPGDALLLGIDLRKDESTLLAAYDDAAGVTARFNLNLLARLNRELGADFDLESFSHRAVWNAAESRIEMHLESLIDQRVKLPPLGLQVEFEAGERIHTENSYKYAPGQAEDMLTVAGFAPDYTWTDAQGWFAVCLARVA
jgi:L-histidine N-alpha-methyltransferase